MNPDGLGVERCPAALALPAHRDHRHDQVVPHIDELDRLLDKLAPHLPEVSLDRTDALSALIDGVIGELGEILNDAVLGEVLEVGVTAPLAVVLPHLPDDLDVLLRHRPRSISRRPPLSMQSGASASA
jgi:hypothetical protein